MLLQRRLGIIYVKFYMFFLSEEVSSMPSYTNGRHRFTLQDYL